MFCFFPAKIEIFREIPSKNEIFRDNLSKEHVIGFWPVFSQGAPKESTGRGPDSYGGGTECAGKHNLAKCMKFINSKLSIENQVFDEASLLSFLIIGMTLDSSWQEMHRTWIASYVASEPAPLRLEPVWNQCVLGSATRMRPRQDNMSRPATLHWGKPSSSALLILELRKQKTKRVSDEGLNEEFFEQAFD